jgi:tripartite-type tricarboxylate transporter receptor subunit TctC
LKTLFCTTSLALVLGLASAPVMAQEDSFAGETIELYIGFAPGGAYDLYARVLANHIGKHLPGEPQVVPMNMEGAGSLLLTNWLYNVAPKDGTVLATISRAVPFFPLIGQDESSSQFDATQFNWIGSANDEVSVCVAWAASGVETIDDLRTGGMVMGGDGPTADGEQFARVMNAVAGTNIDIVTGYGGGGAINLALEGGEVEGRCGWSWSSIVASQPDWLDNEQINVLVQMGSNPHPDLPDVPTLSSLIESDEDQALINLILARQPLGRPFLAPPGVPEERVEMLRQAFMDTMEDPEFIAEAERIALELNPLSGEELQQIVQGVYDNTSDELAARARDILTPQ